jgi:hypothetical protein
VESTLSATIPARDRDAMSWPAPTCRTCVTACRIIARRSSGRLRSWRCLLCQVGHGLPQLTERGQVVECPYGPAVNAGHAFEHGDCVGARRVALPARLTRRTQSNPFACPFAWSLSRSPTWGGD